MENVVDKGCSQILRRLKTSKFLLRIPPVFDPTLSSTVRALGDTQLIMSIGLLTTAVSRLKRGLTGYHFTIIMDLAWVAQTSQITCLTAEKVRQAEGPARPLANSVRGALILLQAAIVMYGSVIQANVYFDGWWSCAAICFQTTRALGGVELKWMAANILFLTWELVVIGEHVGIKAVLSQFLNNRYFFWQRALQSYRWACHRNTSVKTSIEILNAIVALGTSLLLSLIGSSSFDIVNGIAWFFLNTFF
jgi:hypothetical protein